MPRLTLNEWAVLYEFSFDESGEFTPQEDAFLEAVAEDLKLELPIGTLKLPRSKRRVAYVAIKNELVRIHGKANTGTVD